MYCHAEHMAQVGPSRAMSSSEMAVNPVVLVADPDRCGPRCSLAQQQPAIASQARAGRVWGLQSAGSLMAHYLQSCCLHRAWRHCGMPFTPLWYLRAGVCTSIELYPVSLPPTTTTTTKHDSQAVIDNPESITTHLLIATHRPTHLLHTTTNCIQQSTIMWIAHYASGLIAKPLAPAVPLWLLCLAGALPDAVFFVLQFLGIESFRLDPALAARPACFPYANDYPYSHSAAGMAATGVVLAVLYRAYADRPVSARDLAAIVLAAASHFLLEWPSHRAGKPPPLRFRRGLIGPPSTDVKLTPHDAHQLGTGLFDYPVLTFLVEVMLFLAALWVYAAYAPATTRKGYLTHAHRMGAVAAVMLVQQAHFCFGS
ncbi:hypothetical protein AcV5_005113 [Taiwanofungus camphoratus]|nr:hypothetical protein AcV5_005113 [Antrodia cinnamomea]